MKLAEALKTNHRFVVYSYDVAKNVAIYLTDKGPIFCVYGGTGVVNRYINSGDGSKLVSLECSPDLRASKITREDLEQFHTALKKKFKTRNTEIIIKKMIQLASRLEEKKFN